MLKLASQSTAITLTSTTILANCGAVSLSLAAHAAAHWSSAFAIAKGYSVNNNKRTWLLNTPLISRRFCSFKLPQTKFIYIMALCDNYILLKNQNNYSTPACCCHVVTIWQLMSCRTFSQLSQTFFCKSCFIVNLS